MNFMPSDDAFFDEQFHTVEADPYQHPNSHVATVAHRCYSDPSVNADLLSKLVESSLRQEALLERVVREVERLNARLLAVEMSGGSLRGHVQSEPASTSDTKDKSKDLSKPSIPRGSLLLPPGSKPALSTLVPRSEAPALNRMDNSTEREQEEWEAIARLRKEEEERLLIIQAEQKQREAEEERLRMESVKKMEEEKRQRAELEKRTKGILNDLIASHGTGTKGLFDSDDEDDGVSSGTLKESKGLFDD